MTSSLNTKRSRIERGVASEKELQAFELNSCLRKIRYSIEPTCTLDQRAYPCRFCNGWHKTTKRE